MLSYLVSLNYQFDHNNSSEIKHRPDMSDEENILSGAPLDLSLVHSGTLPEYLYLKWQQHPQESALLIDGNTSEVFTVKEMFTKSLQIADGLTSLGLKPKDNVLIFGKNEANLIISQYGILFAGGVMAPVDPNLKKHELEHFRNILEPKVVICDSESLELIESVYKDNAIIVLSKPHAKYPSTPNLTQFYNKKVDVKNYKVPIAHPNDVVVIASSSGTTGLPKGVGLSHKSLLIQLWCWENVYQVARLLQLTQLFWISAILPTFISVIKGICRIYVREFNEQQIFRAIDVYKVETVLIIPPDINILMTHPSVGDYDLSSIKIFYTGATLVFQSHFDFIKKYIPDCEARQGFGCTECTGMLSLGDPWKLSMGSLLNGCKLKVVDPDTNKALPAGKKGELCFKALGMMNGYIKNEEATKAAIDTDGWYHTGDIGYYDENGEMFVTGRIKEIFKFRAAHISPSDMEDIIFDIPGIKEVGVAGIPHPKDVNQPIALVVLKKGAKVTAEEIIKKVEENMASTKRLEAGVRFVDAIPRTTTGKVKRVELQKLAESLY